MMRAKTRTKNNRISKLRMADCGPEKAGVGGSSPSLATTFSSACSLLNPRVCSILFQFRAWFAGVGLAKVERIGTRLARTSSGIRLRTHEVKHGCLLYWAPPRHVTAAESKPAFAQEPERALDDAFQSEASTTRYSDEREVQWRSLTPHPQSPPRAACPGRPRPPAISRTWLRGPDRASGGRRSPGRRGGARARTC